MRQLVSKTAKSTQIINSKIKIKSKYLETVNIYRHKRYYIYVIGQTIIPTSYPKAYDRFQNNNENITGY